MPTLLTLTTIRKQGTNLERQGVLGEGSAENTPNARAANLPERVTGPTTALVPLNHTAKEREEKGNNCLQEKCWRQEARVGVLGSSEAAHLTLQEGSAETQ